MIKKSLYAKKIKDSRNEETIEDSLNGQKASSPRGKSTGKYENPPYKNSIDWNINAINSLKIPFEILSFADLSRLEEFITSQFNLKNAKEFGANTLFALESAILKALAKSQNKELWQIINSNAKKISIPIGNAIGGGLHSHAENHPVFQEFLIIPKLISIKENYKIMKEVYNSLGKKLNSKKINDEGAWECEFEEEDILDLLLLHNINIGIDLASSSFYKNNKNNYKNKSLSKKEQINYINSLIKKYNLFYIEDPLQEEDFKSFSKIKKSPSSLVAGDDLTATQIPRLNKAIKEKSINAIIIKPNQNGSLIEVQEIFNICKKHNIKTILSHRSGETLDSALADYAFAFQADFIKCGIATKWREAKLNRLIEIEKSINK